MRIFNLRFLPGNGAGQALRLSFLGVVATAPMAGSALAATAASQSLDEVVVTATRVESPVAELARSISVADRDRIQNATQQIALDEVLAGIPGLYLQNRYNFAQDLRVSLRGFGARSSFGVRGVRIFVDDIPETLPDGQAQVDSIDIGSAERIEVLRGPASALYGNASGGVIAVYSELGDAAPFAELRLAGGDFGFRKYQFKSAGALKSFGYLLNVSRQEFDGYRDHSAGENDQVNGKLAYDFTENDRLIVSLNHTDQPIAFDPGGIDAAQAAARPTSARDRNVLFDAGESLSQQRAGLVYRHSGGNGELMIRNYYAWRDFSNRLPFTSGGAVDLDRFFYGGGIQYHGRFLADDVFRLIVGFDVDRQDDRRRRFDNNDGSIGDLVFDQSEDVSSDGVYLNARQQLTDAWALSAGLRYDRIRYDVRDSFLADGDDSGDIDFSELSASFGSNYAFGSGVLFAAFSTSFETPTTTELANPGGSGGFNEALRAQTARSVEVGYKWSSERFYAEFALFHIDLDDELVSFELPAFPGRTFFLNAGESTRDGIEAALRWQNGSGFSAEVSYTFSEFEFDTFIDGNGNNFAGNALPGVPRHFAYANVTYGTEAGFFGLFETSYSGSLFTSNANDVSVSSYTNSNIRFGYRARAGRWRVEPYIGVNNLFDESYNSNIRVNAFGGRYFEPAPDRNFYAGIVTRFE